MAGTGEINSLSQTAIDISVTQQNSGGMTQGAAGNV
jgi:hypothetical protein